MTSLLTINTDWGTNEHREKHNEYGGLGYYRLVKPSQYLEEQYYYDIDYLGSDFTDHIDETSEETIWESYIDLVEQYDLVITKAIENARVFKFLYGATREVGVPLIMDLDDNVFEVTENNPAYKLGYKPGELARTKIGTAISLVDALIVSTKPLKEYYTKFLKEAFDVEKPIYVRPNCNDIEDFDYDNGKSENVTIGWAGSMSHDDDLRMIADDLVKVIRDYPEVQVEMVGGVREDVLDIFTEWTEKEIDERLTIKPGTDSWNGYPEYLMSLPFDIALAPLVDNEFNRGKSHIKWMEYSMKKIPTIASNVYPYAHPIQGIETIQNGDTGLLVSSHGWYEAIAELIEDRKKREELGEQAYQFIKDNWQYKDHVFKWHETIQECLEMEITNPRLHE